MRCVAYMPSIGLGQHLWVTTRSLCTDTCFIAGNTLRCNKGFAPGRRRQQLVSALCLAKNLARCLPHRAAPGRVCVGCQLPFIRTSVACRSAVRHGKAFQLRT